jgi:hypothetical protein
MTDAEIRETLRQMLKDWEAATPEQRQGALEAASKAAEAAVDAWPVLHNCTVCDGPVFEGQRVRDYAGCIAHYGCVPA